MKKENDGNDDAEGDILWRRLTQGVKAYESNSPRGETIAAKTPAVRKTRARAVPPETRPPPASDAGTGARLRRGKLAVQARLDLHGMTQAEAFAALRRFIDRSFVQGRRTLLVITGKGALSGGVLRRLVPLWLEDPALRARVLAFAPARPGDGGEGALYVRLRKTKNAHD